jgi:catechol 2,3-dioxygenase-like lactoylglutathione lyase family enzyme
MFLYICLGTSDPARSRRFYDAALGALGITRCVTEGDGFSDWSGWGTYERDGAEQLALWLCPPFDGRPAAPGNGVMIALQAETLEQVQLFHRNALANGGACEGPPGWRPQYNADFYAAYVRDPDGNKLAVVCRGIWPEGSPA